MLSSARFRLTAAAQTRRKSLACPADQSQSRFLTVALWCPPMTLYLEDFHPGDRRALGARTVTREEIIAFAQQFDPQPFHLDDASGVYGGIIASGWHTAALAHRLLVDGLVKDVASLGSPGVDELRWLRPVRPGDTLTGAAEVRSAQPRWLRCEAGHGRASKPPQRRHLIRSRPSLGSPGFEAVNHRGEPVMTFKGAGIFGRRPRGDES